HALAAAAAGRGGLVLLAGEPGIGKTRLAEHFAREAGTQGARIVIGRCHQGDGAPSYWPWVMILRALTRTVERPRLEAWLGDQLAVIAPLVPDIAPGPAMAALAPELDAEAARFRLFDTITLMLGRAAGEQTLVTLLDDLHWADGGSLQLLAFAARQLASERVLLIGTLRPREMQSGTAAARAELARVGQQLDLNGLDRADVTALLRAVLGAEPRSTIAARVHDVTAGNPFFVGALAHVLARTDAPPETAADTALAIPDGVRDVIRARIAPLGAAVQRLLSIGALLGRDFAPPLLARVADTTYADVGAALDEAAHAGIVELEEDAGGRCRFAHALIPETLASDLSALERARLHARIADLLEPLVATGSTTLDDVAAHRFAAAPVEGFAKALDHAQRAAERASARLGYEDAVRHYRRALDFLDSAADGDLRRRAELLLALGEAERRVGDAAAARSTLATAAAVAREADRPDLLARAALAFGAGVGGFWEQSAGAVDDERVALVQQALAALDDAPSGPRALLLANLAGALFWSTSLERRARVEQLSRAAMTMASAVADPAVTMTVLATAHWTTWSPAGVHERLAAAQELVRAATAAVQPEVMLRARMYVTAHHLELGDGASADREIARFAELAGELRQLRQAWYVHVYRGMRAYLAGCFADLEHTAATALALGESAQPAPALMAFETQLTMLRREQGRAAETIERTREVARAAPGMPVWSCALASGLAEAGDLDGAHRELARIAVDRCAPLQRDFFWLYAMTHLARACAALDDAEHAAVLYELLVPFGHQVAVAQHGVISDGAVARYLGLLATVLGCWDDAETHFTDALAINERLGARIFVTATRYDHGRMLLRRGAPADRLRAHALLDAAAGEARGLGQSALLAAIDELRSGARPQPSDGPPEDACALQRGDGVWTVRHGGTSFPVKDTIGVNYLIALLRQPGREIHVNDLVAGPDTVPRARGDAGEMLDADARRTYRERLTELRAELEQAEQFNDVGRTEAVRGEMTALTDELARAVGLGGRPRRAGSDVERARINVTRALRRVVDAIAAGDRALGSDLERGLRTGVFCSYTPDPRLPVAWRT
ncbi:AAA family ATPase, partial [Candidatus Binatia bacterium]|nr:AAA family ATPase [Candidatus Binatia bacterium]